MTVFLDGRVTLHAGDCLEILAGMDEGSVDSCVCDPPYHLTSIVKRFGADAAAPAKVGKTGAFARASAGFMGKKWDGGDVAFRPETWAAVMRVLKPGSYLIAFSGTRTFHRMACAIEDAGFDIRDQIGWCFGSGFPKSHNLGQGRGTALKPAWEPICLARKPLVGTNAQNVEQFGTGGLNIDVCRISGAGDVKPRGSSKLDTDMHEGWARPWMEDRGTVQQRHDDAIERANTLGRWPANLIHDGSDEVLAAFPEAPGQQFASRDDQRSQGTVYGAIAMNGKGYEPRGDEGSAARFFYTAKADADDRLGSKHPTVKPIDLMQYLVRLVTPIGGLVLDPFAGTGTTGEAAWREGMRAVLIEREPEYQGDIARRMELAENPTKRAAVAKSKNNLRGAEGTPLFTEDAA